MRISADPIPVCFICGSRASRACSNRCGCQLCDAETQTPGQGQGAYSYRPDDCRSTERSLQGGLPHADAGSVIAGVRTNPEEF